jgi:hypothetical protein
MPQYHASFCNRNQDERPSLKGTMEGVISISPHFMLITSRRLVNDNTKQGALYVSGK